MSWDKGWYGTYILEDGTIRAQRTSDLEPSARDWDLRIAAGNGAVILDNLLGLWRSG